MYSSDFQFLADENEYRTKWKTCAPVRVDDLVCWPLSHRELGLKADPDGAPRNHFWHHYLKDTFDGDPWLPQAPFRCHLVRKPLVLQRPQDASYRASVSTEVFLATTGWSTHVEITLRARPHAVIDSGQLLDLIRTLHLSGGDATPCFALQGPESVTLSGVFQYFRSVLMSKVFRDGVTARMDVPRQFVMGLNAFNSEAEVVRYRKMPLGDRRFFLSLLDGENRSDADVIGMAGVTLTEMSGKNFALSVFDNATLVFLQDWARNADTKKRDRCRCLAANVRCCLMMSLRLLRFGGSRCDSALDTSLRPNLQSTLEKLPDAYNSQFCKSLFLNHSGLKKAVAPTTPVPAEKT